MAEFNREEYVAQEYLRHEDDAHVALVVRDAHFPVWCVGRGMYLPCVTDVCVSCNQTISASEFIFSEVHLDRVQGDSGNGYEPMHNRCWDRMISLSRADDALHEFFAHLNKADRLNETLAIFHKGRQNYLHYHAAKDAEENKWSAYYGQPVKRVDPELERLLDEESKVANRLSVVRDENPTRLMYPPHEECDCPSCDEARYNASPEFDVDKFYEGQCHYCNGAHAYKDCEAAEFDHGFNTANDDGPF